MKKIVKSLETPCNYAFQTVSQKLPKAYRRLYAAHEYRGHAFGPDHIPLHQASREWAVGQDLAAEFQESGDHSSHPAGAVRAQYVNLGWILLLKDWGENSVGVDLNPGPRGKAG